MSEETATPNPPYGPLTPLQRLDANILAIIRSFGEAALKGQNLDRRETAARMLDVYRNEFAGHVDELLRSMFCAENYADLKLCAHTSTNVLERVVRETTLLYGEPATRYLRSELDERGRRATAGGRIDELLTLSDLELLAAPPAELAGENAAGTTPADAGVEPAETAAPAEAAEAEKTPFDRWLAAYDLDELWAEVHRLARFNPVVWVKPEVREGEDGEQKLTYDLYTPATADVIVSPKDKTQAIAWYTWRDEPKSATGLIENVVELFAGKGSETRRVFHLWTRTAYYQLDEKGKEVRPASPNPLGRLPVVTVRLGIATDGYFLDGMGGDLYDATLEVCALRSMQNRNFRDTFKQLVIGGASDPEKIPQGQVMGNPSLPILLGDEGTAQVLSFDPDLAAMSTIVQEREQGIATKYGISPDAWRRSAAPASGYAKRLDMGRILAMNREDRKYLSTGEADLYRLCALVSQQAGTSGLPSIGQLDPEAPFVVDFAEPKFEEDPETATRASAQRIELGIESVLDLVMEENPDLTEEEAIQLLARNRLVNERFLGKQGTALIDLLALPPRKSGADPGAGAEPGKGGPPVSGAPGKQAPLSPAKVTP